MDGSAFDHLVRLATGNASRRSLLTAAGVSALGAVGLASLLGADEAEAKKGGRKRRRRRCKKNKPAGSPCQSDKDCCTKKTKRICAVAVNAGNSDTTCCGGENATCGGPDENDDDTAPFCCVGFACNSLVEGVPGTCQPLPPE